MKKPYNLTNLIDSSKECDCPNAYIVAYYLSRFDRNAYQNLGFGNMTKTHEKIGKILSISANTIKNFRDAFDPYHDNPRRGWWQRKLWHFEQEIYEGLRAYSKQEISYLIYQILNNPKLSFEELFNSISVDNSSDELIFPDEVRETEVTQFFKEGSIRQIQVNSYERNYKARQACIDYYGTICSVCAFDFEKVFGQIGKGFIHVHHLIPISEINHEYEVDPIKDLRPLCPNCHAMIHRQYPPYTIEEIKTIITNCQKSSHGKQR